MEYAIAFLSASARFKCLDNELSSLRVMEAVIDIRTFKSLHARVKVHDKGSHVVSFVIICSLLLSLLLAFKVPASAITSASDILVQRTKILG